MNWDRGFASQPVWLELVGSKHSAQFCQPAVMPLSASCPSTRLHLIPSSPRPPVPRQHLLRQVGVILFVVVPRDLAVAAEEAGPPHLAVLPVPAWVGRGRANRGSLPHGNATSVASSLRTQRQTSQKSCMCPNLTVAAPASLLQQLQVHLAQVQRAAVLPLPAAVRPEAVFGHHAPLQLAFEVHLAAGTVPHCAGCSDRRRQRSEDRLIPIGRDIDWHRYLQAGAACTGLAATGPWHAWKGALLCTRCHAKPANGIEVPLPTFDGVGLDVHHQLLAGQLLGHPQRQDLQRGGGSYAERLIGEHAGSGSETASSSRLRDAQHHPVARSGAPALHHPALGKLYC